MSILHLFQSDQVLAKKLDSLETEKPDEIIKLTDEVNSYDVLIKKHKIRSWLVENPKNNEIKIVLNKLILLLGLPFFAFGFLLNIIPFSISDTILRRKIKDQAFWSSFSLAMGILLFPIIYLLQLLAFSWIIPGILLKLAFLISMPLTGKLAIKWYIIFRKTVGRSRYFLLKHFKKSGYQKLQQTKEKLFHTLDDLISL